MLVAVVSLIVFLTKLYFIDTETKLEDISLMFFIGDIVLYFVGLIACAAALYRVRALRFISRDFLRLDDILLIVSFAGQLSYCIFTMVGMNATSIGSSLLLFVMILRLTQAFFQTILILLGLRLVTGSEKSQRQKPGRELITFLLIANIALWLVNTFESQRIMARSRHLEFFGGGVWPLIVHITVPLMIFYRFHSSVCFAEIWKNGYKVQKIVT